MFALAGIAEAIRPIRLRRTYRYSDILKVAGFPATKLETVPLRVVKPGVPGAGEGSGRPTG